MLIGELVGKVSTESFKFEAYKEIKKFDFVAVKHPEDDHEWILAQVDEVKKSQEGKTECVANIIGFREKGMLKKPRQVVKPDSMVYRADEDVIAETLGLTTDGCYMGRLETNPDIRIFVDPSDLYKHIAVLAKTGAGKSYATGVLIEELLEQNYPAIIIDPHGEYHSLAHPNDEMTEEDQEKFGIDPKAYNITEYSTETDVNPEAEPLSFSSRNLSAKEIQQITPHSFTNSQIEVLYNALKDLKKRDEPYSLDDIVDKCMSQDSKAKWNVVNMLEHVQESGMFSEDPTDLNRLVRRGHASIVNLRGVDPDDQEMVVYKLAKELFERRKVNQLDPCIMIMEEAHNFVPESNLGKAACSDILRTIASEGRKFGMGIGVISQRPANINKNILSQCNIQLIMRVTNSNDLSAIGRSFEGITKEVENSIKSLSPGVGLLLGKEYPVMTDIRTRRSKHGGVTQQLKPQDDTDAEAVEEAGEPAGLKPGIGDGPESAHEAAEQNESGTVAAEEPAEQAVAAAADTSAAAVKEVENQPDAENDGSSGDEDELPAVDHEEADEENDVIFDGSADTSTAEPDNNATEPSTVDTEQEDTSAQELVEDSDPSIREESAEAVSTADEVPESDVSQTEQESGEEKRTPADSSSEPATDETSEEPRFQALTPELDPDALREEFGSLKTAYYPLWIVSSAEEKIAVDGTDGEIKARQKPLDGRAEKILDLLKTGDKSRGNLLEALDVSLSKLDRLLTMLEEEDLVAEKGDKYTYNGVDVFDRETVPVYDDRVTQIDTDISEGKAIKIAKTEMADTPEAVKKVYYPYYTAGKRVFDAVLGEEI